MNLQTFLHLKTLVLNYLGFFVSQALISYKPPSYHKNICFIKIYVHCFSLAQAKLHLVMLLLNLFDRPTGKTPIWNQMC